MVALAVFVTFIKYPYHFEWLWLKLFEPAKARKLKKLSGLIFEFGVPHEQVKKELETALKICGAKMRGIDSCAAFWEISFSFDYWGDDQSVGWCLARHCNAEREKTVVKKYFEYQMPPSKFLPEHPIWYFFGPFNFLLELAIRLEAISLCDSRCLAGEMFPATARKA